MLVRRNPQLRVHVSAIGAPHLIDPSRLERSARRLYGDAFDALWGEIAPVPEENVDVLGEHGARRSRPSPRPATPPTRSASWRRTGRSTPAMPRACGSRPAATSCRTHRRRTSTWRPGTGRWTRSSAAARPRLALPHFGVFEDVDDHLATLRARIDLWTERVGNGISVEEFVAEAEADVVADGEDDTEYFTSHAPWVPSYLGLERYWAKRREAEAA